MSNQKYPSVYCYYSYCFIGEFKQLYKILSSRKVIYAEERIQQYLKSLLLKYKVSTHLGVGPKVGLIWSGNRS